MFASLLGAAFGLGTYLIITNEMTIGTLVAFLTYVASLFGPVTSLTNTYRVHKNATVSSDHIFTKLNCRPFRNSKIANPGS